LCIENMERMARRRIGWRERQKILAKGAGGGV
jgi:hypothetical protein